MAETNNEVDSKEVDWDYLYEVERDDKLIRQIDKMMEKHECCICKGIYEEWDMDLCDEGWICKECEELL